MITIISDDAYERPQDTTREAYFNLRDMDIQPCYSCGGCTYKTYKKCVVRDDMDKVIPKLLISRSMIIITRVVFGGYSFAAKRMMDKFALVGDQHYHINSNGELVKGLKQNQSTLNIYAIGIIDKGNDAQAATFKRLFRETINITGAHGDVYTATDTAAVNDLIKEVIGRE